MAAQRRALGVSGSNGSHTGDLTSPREASHPPTPSRTALLQGRTQVRVSLQTPAASDKVQTCASQRAQTLYILRAAACVILSCHFM